MLTPKILIADDDTKYLKALGIALKASGYEVLLAQDSYQALQLARRHLPDVILLDINMPAGDGFSVQDRLQSIPGVKNVPVIYFTGDQSRNVAKQSRSHGAFALLHKPFETDDLLMEIESALGMTRAEAHTAT